MSDPPTAPGLRYAYNTNGLAHHRLDEALHWLADLGYAGVALTPDVQHLDPYRTTAAEVSRIAGLLERLGLDVVIQTGARYLVDPHRKHHPTLLAPDASDRERRVDLLRRCLDLGRDLGAQVLSCWSGVVPTGTGAEEAHARLDDGLLRVADLAAERSLWLALEPEPGMLVATVSDFDQVLGRLAHPALRLSLDVGHVHCNREGDVGALIRSHAAVLADVQIEDMREGVHEHLPLGTGTMDFGPIFEALVAIDFPGLVGVELSRDSHRAHVAVPRSITFLRRAEALARSLSE